jgi:3-polyprenyl-4-hydroxybenzoate decarboxylase
MGFARHERFWGAPIAMSADVKKRVDALWGKLGIA